MSIRAIPAPRMPMRQSAANVPSAFFRLPAFTRDAIALLSVITIYFVLRGLAPDRLDFAVVVTEHIVAFEERLGIFFEPQIQEWSIQHHAVKEVANFTYAYLHFPVLGVVAIWLWWKDRERFVFARNVMFVSMVIGLVFYYLLPAAPPRLLEAHGMDLGFTDTVFGGDTSVKYAQPSYILNEYAAIPSFHFGWIALAAAIIWTNTTNRILRGAGLFLAVLMTWAIVASANHFFVDMALGGLVIVASWKAARVIESQSRLHDPSYRGP